MVEENGYVGEDMGGRSEHTRTGKARAGMGDENTRACNISLMSTIRIESNQWTSIEEDNFITIQ
jgi:hypothetical protein